MNLLRFLACGSVDDGKSTLIGRLLYDSHSVSDDQVEALAADSRTFGTTGDDIDVALLLDGLVAEREQGITIDVAYRYFTTSRRRFIVADTPGHEQYTRNMATGASHSELAVLLVDARQGVLTQTRRHAYVVALLGIRDVVLAVNKMDLAGFDEARYAEIVRDFSEFATPLEFKQIAAIPLSARFGDNVTKKSARTPWYQGPSLLEYLETVTTAVATEGSLSSLNPFRFPVQLVNRPDATFRGYAGTVASGRVRAGDAVCVARSGRPATIARIVTLDGDLDEARTGDAVTLTLTTEVDISRGDVLCPPDGRPEVSDQFTAHLVWMHENELLPGRPYLLKTAARTVGAAVTGIKHRVDVDTFQSLAANTLRLNDIGLCNLSVSESIAFDPYENNRTTGSFILIDRFLNATVAAGMIRHGLRRATNVRWQPLAVDKPARAELKGQRPCILWFTGLSGAGKSTIANLVERKLLLMGRHTYLLDGDNVRHGLSRDLGFTDAARVENIRRVAEAAKLFVDAGLIVLVAVISPFRAERLMARELVAGDEFLEIFVDATLAVAEARDPKGLYRKARAGEIPHFTGLDSPYEPPIQPDLRLDTTATDADTLADRVVEELVRRRYVPAP